MGGKLPTRQVSVVIATYCTGPALDAVVACLDKQTLPATEFEVVWVDDGSPDDTPARLREFATSRPNYVVKQIENSGWPGRPRNIGVRAARGDFVFFMDHDDYLFPEALERMSAFAHANELDVLHPKEVVAGWHRPGWASWRQQTGHLTQLDQAILQCITPHKLYRRQYLLDHDIWFPEGRIRLEDFDLNAQAWSQTDRIGVLADYPCYTWILHADNSHKRGFDVEVYWRSFERSLQPIYAHLPPGDKRDHLLVRWYRSRMLQRLTGESIARLSDEDLDGLCRRFERLLHYFPPEIDRLMTPADRARSALLRAKDYIGIRALAADVAGMELGADVSSAAWHDGRLQLEVTGSLVDGEGQPVRFERRDDAIVRVLPATLAGGGADNIDVRADVAAAIAEIVVRARSTAVDWILHSDASIEFIPIQSQVADSELQIRFTIAARLDFATSAGGAALGPDVWDVFYRVDDLGWARTAWMPAPTAAVPPALLSRGTAVLYPTRIGNLAIDTADEVRTFVSSAVPRLRNARAAGSQLRVAMPDVYCDAVVRFEGSVFLDGTEVPAHIVGTPGDAILVIDSASVLAAGTIRAKFGASESEPLFAAELSALRKANRAGTTQDGVTAEEASELEALVASIPAELDDLLSGGNPRRLRLIRTGDLETLSAMNRAVQDVQFHIVDTSAGFSNEKLQVLVSGLLALEDNTPVSFKSDGSTIVLNLPDGAEPIYVDKPADEIATRVVAELVFRGRQTRQTYIVPMCATMEFADVADRPGKCHVRVSLRCALDARALAADESHKLDGRVWDISYRLRWHDWDWSGPVPSPEIDRPAGLIAGVRMVLYPTREGTLAVDTTDKVRPFVVAVRPRLADASIVVGSDGSPVTRIALPDVEVAGGETELHGTIDIDGAIVAASLCARDGTAALLVQATGLESARAIRANFGGRDSALFEAELAALRHKPLGESANRLARSLARRLRRSD